MSEPFIGEVRIFAGNYVPVDYWLPCDGRPLFIDQYQALHAVIGNLYGGYGNTFRLPNLTGLAPLGRTHNVAEISGQESVVLSSSTMPTHTHQMTRKGPVSTSSKHNTPTAASDVGALAVAATNSPFAMMAPINAVDTTLAYETMGWAWGGKTTGDFATTDPHENRQPFLVLTFAIAFGGVFPEL
jgi:microcystin-dependent protein